MAPVIDGTDIASVYMLGALRSAGQPFLSQATEMIVVGLSLSAAVEEDGYCGQ